MVYQQNKKPVERLSKEWFQAQPVITVKSVEVMVQKPDDAKSVDKAIKILKRKMNEEGILQEVRDRRYFIKNSVKKRLKTIKARKTAHLSVI
jgi:ribosomal protein S21